MNQLYVMVTAHLLGLTDRVKERMRDDTGLGTLEIVVISVGLFVIATAAIAYLTPVVASWTGQITGP
jgi:hypothetical protein